MRNNAFNSDAEGSTENDAAIARAIADSELHSHSHNAHNITTSPPIAPQHHNSASNCPGKHGLELFQASNSQRVKCNGCQKQIRAGDRVWSCVECNVDCCESCYLRGSQLVVSASAQSNSSHNRTSNSTSPPMPNVSPSSQFNNPFAARTSPSSHMCLIPCTIGSITVEMMVDTGAQSSVLSMPLVTQLGLTNRVDRRYQGVAAGVGRARISGRIRNVVCTFGVGHVEFLMDFIVLDVNDPLVIIGLDQMRKYKCLVDMEREKLIFGGAGGVEVEMRSGLLDLTSDL